MLSADSKQKQPIILQLIREVKTEGECSMLFPNIGADRNGGSSGCQTV